MRGRMKIPLGWNLRGWYRMECLSLLFLQLFHFVSSTGLPGWKSRELGMVANGRFDICLGILRIRCANLYGDQARATPMPASLTSQL